MDAFIQTSEGLAELFGERQGRTTSRVIGQGLADLTGLTHDNATDIAHIAMVAAVANPDLRKPVCFGLAALFLAGLSSGR